MQQFGMIFSLLIIFANSINLLCVLKSERNVRMCDMWWICLAAIIALVLSIVPFKAYGPTDLWYAVLVTIRCWIADDIWKWTFYAPLLWVLGTQVVVNIFTYFVIYRRKMRDVL